VIQPYPDRRRIGREKEQLAARFLRSRGLRILTSNYQCRSGEIDLIAEDEGYLVFVEVRYRSKLGHGTALDTVTSAKQNRILRCATHYLTRHPHLLSTSCRFDVVGLDRMEQSQRLSIRWVKNAFQSSGW